MTRKRRATPYLFLLPALALLGVFVFYPIVAVFWYSLTDYDIVRPPVFVGLDNFVALLDDDTFKLALVHSFVYLLVTPILIALSIGLAIIVNRKLRGIHIYRALYFVPAVSGSIAIGLSWRWLFDRSGFVNSVLQSWGLIDEPIQWLATPALVLPIAMMLTIWAGIGYYSVIFLAGLQNVPEELYDAARIDGCSDLQKHRYVSIPALRPQIVFVGGDLEPRRAEGVRRDLRPDQPDRRHPRQRRDDGVLPVGAGVRAPERRLCVGDRDRACWSSRSGSRSSTCGCSSAATWASGVR